MAEMWYYTNEGKQMDAVPMKELKRLVGEGVLKPTDMVWKDGMPRWIRASSVEELFPDPSSALDRFFTSTRSKEAPMSVAPAVASPAAASNSSTSVSATPAAGSAPAPVAPAEQPRERSKRQKSEPSAEDDDSTRQPRRRAEADGGGGSNLGIILALLVGGGVLLMALVVGVIILVFAFKSGPAAPKLADNKPPEPIVAEQNPGKNDPPLQQKEPPPQQNEPPLPPGAKEGKGQFQMLPTLPGKNRQVVFRVKGGHAASINVTPLAIRPTTDFNVIVIGQSDNRTIAQDAGIDPNARVNFTVPKTEIVTVRVQNRGTTSHRCIVFYDVSP